MISVCVDIHRARMLWFYYVLTDITGKEMWKETVKTGLKKNLRNTMLIFLSWSRFDYLLLTVIILVKARTPSF